MEYGAERIRTHFTQNFGLFLSGDLTLEWCRKQVTLGKDVKKERMDRFHYCWDLYKNYVKNPYKIDSSEESTNSSSIECGLDGDYWTMFVREED